MTRELCIMACAFCRDPQFHSWLASLAPGHTYAEADAKEFILGLCGIESRTQLDTLPAAAQRFHTLVRLPFMEWRGEREL